jgi:hypothetical protein
MARRCTRALTEWIDLAPGAVASGDGGPMTVAVLWRPVSVHSGALLYATNAGGFEAHSYCPINDGQLWHQIGGSFRALQGYTAADGWRLDAWTKPGGVGQTVRAHSTILGSGTWSHIDGSTCDDTSNVPVSNIRVGQKLGVGALDGDVAAIVICLAVWDDATIETLDGGLAAWDTAIGGDAAALWAFNQASAADPVLDLCGGGADQTAISGTSVTDDPAGWSYDLTEPATVTAAGTLPSPSGSTVVTVANPVTVSVAAALPTPGSVAVAAVANPVAVTGSATAPSPTAAAVATSTTNPPNSELVAVAWLGSITGLSSSQVATKLPTDTSAWSDDGFVTVGGGDGAGGGVIGGAPHRYLALRAPVVSVHCWAVTPGSGRPPWGKAARLAELIVAGTYDETTMRRALTLPAGYASARVNEAYALTEPRRIPGDDASYAHFQLDLQLHWVAT